MTCDTGPHMIQLFNGPADGTWVPWSPSGYLHRYWTSDGTHRESLYTFRTSRVVGIPYGIWADDRVSVSS